MSRPITRGDMIVERQHNGREKAVLEVAEGSHVTTVALASGKVTRIAWRNVRRYRIIGYAPPQIMDAHPITGETD